MLLAAQLVLAQDGPQERPVLPLRHDINQRLVNMVHEAAELLEQKGSQAFVDFSQKGCAFTSGESYLFVYDDAGFCLYHPVVADLIGKNLMDMRDIYGKPVIKWIVQGREHAADSERWEHYLWGPRGAFLPRWKSSYIKNCTMPDGKKVVVGAGLNEAPMERRFLVDLVHEAENLVHSRGEKAFAAFVDPAGPFMFRDTYIFVLTLSGNAVVNPELPTLKGHNILDYQDALGRHVIREMITRLKDRDWIWMSYLLSRLHDTPEKRLAYVVKTEHNGKIYLVGADMREDKPIWMR